MRDDDRQSGSMFGYLLPEARGSAAPLQPLRRLTEASCEGVSSGFVSDEHVTSALDSRDGEKRLPECDVEASPTAPSPRRRAEDSLGALSRIKAFRLAALTDGERP